VNSSDDNFLSDLGSRTPSTEILLKVLKRSEAFQASPEHFEDVIGRGIQDTLLEENCELLRKKLLVALSKCLCGKTKVSQACVRSKHYNQECEAIKNCFVHKNLNGNLYIRSFLYVLLTGVLLLRGGQGTFYVCPNEGSNKDTHDCIPWVHRRIISGTKDHRTLEMESHEKKNG
jgi:hypothetical protein